MKKIILEVLVFSIIIIFFGCNRDKRWEEKITVWEAPNWTSDNKIVFLEHYYVQKWKETATGDAQVGGSEKITVCELNNDGTGLKKIAIVKENEFNYGPCLGGISSSSTGDWIVLNIEDWDRGDHYPVMYVIKRDGSGLKEVGSGRNSDFSSDTFNFVYEKPNQGIWIMNRGGTNDHKIVSNGLTPTWSPKEGKIAYILGDSLVISDTSGNHLIGLKNVIFSPDWGQVDSNTICGSDGYNVNIIHLGTGNIDTLKNISTAWRSGVYWSPDAAYFIGYYNNWFVIKQTGENKWALKP
ncbi:MAG: hypothetical protein WC614_12985 [bacterium]